MELKKLDLTKIQAKEGFDTFDLLKNGADLEPQKVSAVIKNLVDTVNMLIDKQKAQETIVVQCLSHHLPKLKKKRG